MKMKKLGLLLMLLCTSFAMHAQELKKGDKLPDFQLKSSVYGDVSSADLRVRWYWSVYLPLGAAHASWNLQKYKRCFGLNIKIIKTLYCW